MDEDELLAGFEIDALRAHHILCTALYEGKGYSGAFCENMTAVVARLKENPDMRLHLVAQPDMICAGCPNLSADDTCAQNHNRVADKDRRVMDAFGLKEGVVYSYRELCGQVRQAINEELFIDLCGTCEWHAKGLCRYDDLIARLGAACREST